MEGNPTIPPLCSSRGRNGSNETHNLRWLPSAVMYEGNLSLTTPLDKDFGKRVHCSNFNY
jgi:hypothetical protein